MSILRHLKIYNFKLICFHLHCYFYTNNNVYKNKANNKYFSTHSILLIEIHIDSSKF